MANDPIKPERDWTEELTVTGQELVLLEIPLTAGVVAGGAVTIFAPVLAALGALAALLSEFRVEVIRTDQPDEDDD
jgi:hypothetical protein